MNEPDPILVEAVGDHFVIKDGSVAVTAETRHAWPEPRGEVYVTLDASEHFEAFGLEDLEDGYSEIVAGLTPKGARALASALMVLADHAETYPARYWDERGRPVHEEH